MTDNEIRDKFLNAFEWLEKIKGSNPSDENYINADIIQKFINCYQKEINHQKEEIERKTTECERLEIYMDELVKQKLKQAKFEAYREFADRLKNLTASYWLDNINKGHIDKLVKELTESK